MKLVEVANSPGRIPKNVIYTIADKETDDAAGMIGLFRIERQHKRAEIGYWLDKPYWGRGIVTEAVMKLLDVGFRNLKLHRVYAPVFHPNKASMKVLTKCGFTHEGFFRHSYFRRGRWMDEHWFSILKEEFTGKQQRRKRR